MPHLPTRVPVVRTRHMAPHMRGGMEVVLENVVSGLAAASGNNPTGEEVVVALGGPPAIFSLAPLC